MSDVILLDYNGVIVDDEPLHFAALREVLESDGMELARADYYADFLGYDDHTCFAEAFRRSNRTLSGELLRVLVRAKADAYRKLAADNLPAVPGAVAFVKAVAARWPVAVVSGALRAEITDGLARLGLDGTVAEIVAAEDVRTTKPDPAGHRLALAKLAAGGPAPARAVVIEDSRPGRQAARAIGAGCVMLATSHAAETLTAADAVWRDFVGRGPADLEPWFRPLLW